METYKESILAVFFNERKDSGRFTSQDICDNLRDTVTLTPDEVTEWMMTNGYVPMRDDDRVVWTVM